jgi:hypothetical protein
VKFSLGAPPAPRRAKNGGVRRLPDKSGIELKIATMVELLRPVRLVVQDTALSKRCP